jgi:hypothetical protein
MAAAKDFKSFYDTHLLPSLGELRERSQVSRRWLQVAIASVAFGIIYFVLFFVVQEQGGMTTVPLVAFFIVAVVGIGLHINTKDDYILSFKQNIIHTIVDFIYPGITYEPGKYINSKHYKNSCLERYIYSDINGDDFFKGVYKGVSFTCSELHTHQRGEEIFHGLFFIAKINSYYNAGTYVWSKGNEQIAKSVYTDRYRYFPMPKVYNMVLGDPAFDRRFSVSSTHPAQAREILSSSRMQQMINFHSKLNPDISFSFVGGYCYVGYPTEKSLFTAGKDPGDEANIKEHFMNILTFLSFIDKLMLNEMI